MAVTTVLRANERRGWWFQEWGDPEPESIGCCAAAWVLLACGCGCARRPLLKDAEPVAETLLLRLRTVWRREGLSAAPLHEASMWFLGACVGCVCVG
jgi:hypothetical protein